mmetsp:Transcript_50156/g.160522  ORF Transcript_50156/g.160522 Transcript_50156/m.160522 type:complete len:206 (-) Transcript_50156:95-712(-)
MMKNIGKPITVMIFMQRLVNSIIIAWSMVMLFAICGGVILRVGLTQPNIVFGGDVGANFWITLLQYISGYRWRNTQKTPMQKRPPPMFTTSALMKAARSPSAFSVTPVGDGVVVVSAAAAVLAARAGRPALPCARSAGAAWLATLLMRKSCWINCTLGRKPSSPPSSGALALETSRTWEHSWSAEQLTNAPRAARATPRKAAAMQ